MYSWVWCAKETWVKMWNLFRQSMKSKCNCLSIPLSIASPTIIYVCLKPTFNDNALWILDSMRNEKAILVPSRALQSRESK